MSRFHEILAEGRKAGLLVKVGEDTSVQLGVTIFDRRTRHADDPEKRVKGVVIDRWADDDGEFQLRAVERWRRQIRYHTVPEAEAEFGASGNLMRADVVKDLVLALSDDEVQRGDPMRHMHAKQVLVGLLYRAGHHR